VDPHPDLRAVEVVKTRHRYTIGGCLAELTDVRAGQAATRTLAIESEDPSHVIATVRELGLAGRPNVSFARGIKVLLRFGADRFAVVDVGTNSVKLHIGERGVDGGWRTLVDRAEVTRLGEGLRQTGRLGPEPMTRTVEAIAGMAEEARRHRVAAIVAVGTAGLRMAPNGAELVDAVLERCGVAVEVISGEDEARLAYVAATAGLAPQGSRVVFDTGGGSSQFTFGHGDRVDERFSIEVGAARFTEEYGLGGPVSRDGLATALGAIEAGLARLDGRPAPDSLIGMGGAVTNLAAVRHGLAVYDPDVVQGTVLDRAEVDRQVELYRTSSAAQRRTVVGLQPDRAEVILAGACIVRTVLEKLGRDSLTVSDRGLRHGVLAERFGRL
jgi:exopolyphosphatase/guanosine-5'-triphosphate,3'-diphosphate pyrophosphatase